MAWEEEGGARAVNQKSQAIKAGNIKQREYAGGPTHKCCNNKKHRGRSYHMALTARWILIARTVVFKVADIGLGKEPVTSLKNKLTQYTAPAPEPAPPPTR